MQPSFQPSSCVDEEGWVVGGSTQYAGLTCDAISINPDNWCSAIMNIPDSMNMGKAINEACCFCNGSTYKTTYPSTEPSGFPTLTAVPTIEPIPSSQPSECFDEPDWYFNVEEQLGCLNLADNPEDKCARFSTVEYMHNEKVTYDACCICGGGIHHSTQPSDDPSVFPSDTPTMSPSTSSAPSNIPSRRTAEPSDGPTLTQTPTDFPSMEPESKFHGDNCNYSSECIGEMICMKKYCSSGVSLDKPYADLELTFLLSNIVFSPLACQQKDRDRIR